MVLGSQNREFISGQYIAMQKRHLRKWRRCHNPFTPYKTRIISNQSQRKGAALIALAGISGRAVNGAIIKGNGITGPDRPTKNFIIIAMAIDVRNGF